MIAKFTKSIFLITCFFATLYGFSQTDVLNPGTTSYTVPCGVTSITVKVWGGGGGGGNGACSGLGCLGAGRGGGGGGAGGFSTRTYAGLTPGQVIACTVGGGGAAGAAGGASTFSGPGFILTANGGAAGGNGAAAVNGAGGVGGTASNGTTNTSGNNGNAGGAPAGGAGGANPTAGSGAGGAAAANGSAPGGGGGGEAGASTLTLILTSPGAGGAGRIEITYTPSITYSTVDAGVDIILAACATTTNLNAAVLTSAPAGFEGTGTWSCVTNCGGVGITTPASVTSGITGLTVPNASTFRWTVTRPGCPTVTSDVMVSTVSGPGCPTCTDAIQNQGETGVDCGGLFCAPCGAPCTTFIGATNDIVGGVVDASAGNQTISTCVSISYSNRGTNWLHGVFMNPASTGFVSTAATGALPEPNSGSYKWVAQTANFTGSASGNSVTQDGWFVETGAANTNPGDNLGWPVGANIVYGPFCFQTVVSCDGLSGDVAAFLNFQTTGDSYSGSWTNVDCGKETSFGASSFSYTLRCPVTLPLELLSFKGKYHNRSVQLNWSTASETNNDYFTVLKSSDGIDFKEIATVDGAGTSTVNLDYSTVDYSPISPIGYYKIRQTDFNGQKSESNVVAIISPAYFEDLNVIPNPVTDLASVFFNSSVSEMTNVRVRDVSGKLFLIDAFESEKGTNSFSFNTEGFANGVYFMEISNGLDLRNIKFVKQK